jgi:phospholipid transport system transporter-binding protein
MTAGDRGFQLTVHAPGTLAVDGVLSFGTAAAALQALELALADGAHGRLDLAGVRHSDSAGLSCVLAVAAEAGRRGHPLQVVNMPASMRTLAQVCEVDGLLVP